MQSDNKFIMHGLTLDKVLGYRYASNTDHMQLHSITMNSNANTKRKIISESSEIFDPLSLCGPITVRSKQLLSKLWKRKRLEITGMKQSTLKFVRNGLL